MPHFRRFHGHLCRNILSQARNRFQLMDEGKKIKSLPNHKLKEKLRGIYQSTKRLLNQIFSEN